MSIAYLRFRNYRNTDAIFVSNNIALFLFSMKNMKVKVIKPFIDSFRPFSSLCELVRVSFFIIINQLHSILLT